jgi:hypothetical protein
MKDEVTSTKKHVAEIEREKIAEIDRLFQSKCEEVVALKKEVAEYQQKLADGRMVELPCKIGDTVWLVASPENITNYDEEYEEGQIQVFDCRFVNYTVYKDGKIQIRLDWRNKCVGWYLTPEHFGKVIFLTKEEAEQALKEVDHKQNENPCLACGCESYNQRANGCEMPSEDLMQSCPLEM